MAVGTSCVDAVFRSNHKPLEIIFKKLHPDYNKMLMRLYLALSRAVLLELGLMLRSSNIILMYTVVTNLVHSKVNKTEKKVKGSMKTLWELAKTPFWILSTKQKDVLQKHGSAGKAFE